MKITANFSRIYQSFSVSDEKILKVEQIYVRKVKYSDVKEKCEFVWIEIDCTAQEVRIHLENNAKNLSVKLQGKPMAMYKHFSGKLQKEFLVTPLPNPQEATLFKMYRKLTSYAEQEYLNKVESYQSEIDDFTNVMTDTLHLSNDGTMDITNRIKWVFVRQLIQNDFDKFLKIQQQGEGRVKSILFHYDEGGTINANSGTIELPEKKTKQVLTRYRAYKPFLLTHFLKENVSKGAYDNVFPRIKEFEKLPL